jgi:endonuclease/exonuclease/phosphatase family metal-dependent hydrolase
VKRLLGILRNAVETVILLGDINEWVSMSPWLRDLHSHLGKSHCPRTFPSRFPLLALDRIWVRPKDNLQSIRAHKSALSRIASDHLPVVADIILPLGY